ncbi:MAG: SDR family NAD(P)-dependent oxidoreductase, partial [Planctomycetes bacterium]|nr:SDR family NAD(P)-dependent oxidoreductase [Planctomycetota bacterium]
MDIRFDSKVALVTGGASGIGAAIANELSASGAAVAILDVNADGVHDAVKAIEADGGVALGCPVDVTDAEATAASVEAATAELGGLDIIVNCAGKAGTRAFLDADPEETRQLVEVNLLSTVYVCQAALPHLVERGGGRVVNISSD